MAPISKQSDAAQIDRLGISSRCIPLVYLSLSLSLSLSFFLSFWPSRSYSDDALGAVGGRERERAVGGGGSAPPDRWHPLPAPQRPLSGGPPLALRAKLNFRLDRFSYYANGVPVDRKRSASITFIRFDRI